jgi:hypothetical protein
MLSMTDRDEAIFGLLAEASISVPRASRTLSLQRTLAVNRATYDPLPVHHEAPPFLSDRGAFVSLGRTSIPYSNPCSALRAVTR